jgi:hypothetical protein
VYDGTHSTRLFTTKVFVVFYGDERVQATMAQ